MTAVVLSGIKLAAMDLGAGHSPAVTPYGLIEQAALAMADGKICWCGDAGDLPVEL